MNDECFQISIDSFLSKQNLVDEHINPRLADIIRNKILIHSCFCENNVSVMPKKHLPPYAKLAPPPPPHSHSHSHNQHQHQKEWSHKNNYHVSNRNKRYNTSAPLIRKKLGDSDDVSRTLLSLLNKLTHANFDKIKHKLELTCSDYDSANMLIRMILKKATYDITYISIYIHLLNTVENPVIVDQIPSCSLEYIKAFFYSLPYTLSNINSVIQYENNLNKYLKLKKEIFNSNICCCYIIHNHFPDIEPSQYIDFIRTLFYKFQNFNVPEIYDIYIHFVYDFCTINNLEENKQEQKLFVENLIKDQNENQHQALSSKKTHFKIQDLVNLIGL